MKEDVSDLHAATRKNVTQELIYPTTLRLRGPWLLETNHLLALDEILEKFGSREMEPETREQGQVSGPGLPHGFKSQKSLTIFLSKDRELKTSGFRESLSNIASQN